MKDKPQQLAFAPIFDANSKILILGSFPSVKSRQVDFYYGNNQNKFWKMMQNIFGGDLSSTQGKKQLCLQNNVALWDIVSACNIDGSLDVNIKNPTFVDLAVVLNVAPIKAIFCNGKKAYQFTLRAYDGQLPVVCLPSTSPANTSFSRDAWLDAFEKYLKE